MPSRACCGEVAGIFLESLVLLFRGRGVGRAALAEFGDRLDQRIGGGAGGLQRIGGFPFALGGGKQQALDGDIVIARVGRVLFRQLEELGQFLAEAGLRAAGGARLGCDKLLDIPLGEVSDRRRPRG